MAGHGTRRATYLLFRFLSWQLSIVGTATMRFLPKLGRKLRHWKKLKKSPLSRKLDLLHER